MIATRFAIQSAEHAPPTWFVFRSPRHVWAANWFEANGVEAWIPMQTRWQTRIVQGRRKRVAVELPIIAGYVFAAFRGAPIWHEIRDRALGRITSVLCTSDGFPRPFTDQEMMAMSTVPHRLDALRREEEERLRIHAGDEARHGTFGRVKVTGVDGNLATFIAPLFGAEREVTVELTALEKLS